MLGTNQQRFWPSPGSMEISGVEPKITTIIWSVAEDGFHSNRMSS